jgi:hypothetical protein
MAGYSGKPLSQKLGIRESDRILLRGEPEGFRSELEPLPAGVTFVPWGAEEVDLALLFVKEAATLEREFVEAMTTLTMAGMLWVAWPKKASKVPTDLTEDVIREIGLAQGLVDVKVCAINEIWSGLKFVRRLKDRK